jgi:hypothetical protein
MGILSSEWLARGITLAAPVFGAAMTSSESRIPLLERDQVPSEFAVL